VSYLKNNHPHHKQVQKAENPARDRRSAQRCWAKVCRDVGVGVRPKCRKKTRLSQIPAVSAFFPGVCSKDPQRGRSPCVSDVFVGCWCKELPFPKPASCSTVLLTLGWLALCCSRLPTCVRAHAYAACLHTAAYLFIC